MGNNIEIERKFIIKLPKLDLLRSLSAFTESEIVQIYLESDKTRTRRIRSRISGGTATYTKTEKIRIDEMSAIENEEEIDGERFLLLEKSTRKGSRPIKKKRLTFEFSGRIIELDIYPEWTRTCIMEIELASRDEIIDLPPFIEVVREVTGNKAYSNSSMSEHFPEEEKI